MRSRLRAVRVDGREFTWKADIRSGQGADGRRRRYIRVRVWGAGKTGRALQADLVQRRQPAADGDETYPYPGAEDVRAIVRYGLAAGWVPETLGGTFLVASTSGLTLPEFVVTDVFVSASGGTAW